MYVAALGGYQNTEGFSLVECSGMKRVKILSVFFRAILGIVIFVAVGAGVRAFLERLPWTRTVTYREPDMVEVLPAPTSSMPVLEPETIIEEEETVSAPTVLLSLNSAEQSDVFSVMLRDVPSSVLPRVTWHGRTYDLLKTGERWIGFLGVDAKQAPSTYTLTVSIGTTTLSRQVTVTKRSFPVTVLAVTPALEEQGYTPPAIQSNVAIENERLNAALIYRPEHLFSGTFTEPLSRITVVGAYGNIRRSGSVELQHLGVDLDAAEGTPVYAVNDGVVNLAEEFVNYGKTIVVDHGLGIFSYYLHLDEFEVEKGDRVTRGEVIAKSGNTGYSIAPHLHFSIRIRNASVDPLRFIEAANEALR